MSYKVAVLSVCDVSLLHINFHRSACSHFPCQLNVLESDQAQMDAFVVAVVLR